MNRDGILFQYSLATEGCGSGEVQEVLDLSVCRLLLQIRSHYEWSFSLHKGGCIMRNYWYISLTNEYPRTIDDCSVRVVRSVQIKGKYSIVEMLREATPNEVDKCKLIYCGHGYWKDEYIQKNIRRYLS